MQKIKICDKENVKFTQYLHRREKQHPNAHLPAFYDSPPPKFELQSLARQEGGLNFKEPKDYETEYAASLTACAPLEDEDPANSHLTQESLTHDRRTAGLNNIQSSEKDFMKRKRFYEKPFDLTESHMTPS